LGLAALLCLSLALNIVPVWWGLPSVDDKSWAFDELSPDHYGLDSPGRHRGRYPPLHYDLLRAVYKPVRHLNDRGLLNLSETELRGLLQTVGRVLSSLMATTTVLLVFLTGRLVMDYPGPLLSSAVIAFSAPFVFFAKTINLEAPYVFWFALALYFYSRTLRTHRLADYLAFAAAMTLSICTKDQAFALFVLPLVWLIVDLHRHPPSDSEKRRTIIATLLDRRLVWSGLLALALFVLIHDLLFGFEDFLHHLEFMRGPGARGWREYETNLTGQISMLAQAIVHTAFAMSWPAFIAATLGIGVVLGNRRQESRLLALALFPISYYLFFITVAQFHYVRFFLPVALVLALFSGRFSIALLKLERTRAVARIAIALMLLVAARRAISLDLEMLNDSRYRVERWLADNSVAGYDVSFLGSRSQIHPRNGATPVPLEIVAQRPLDTLRSLDSEFVVVNELEPVNGKQNDLVAELRSGDLNYLPVFEPRYRPWIGSLSYAGVRTNLNSVNPPLTVFQRSAPWGPTDRDIQQRLVALDESSPQDEWNRLTEAILRTPVLGERSQFGTHLTAFGLAPDGWTRGQRPAALIVFNDKQTEAELLIGVSCGADPSNLPLTASFLTFQDRTDLTFENSGRHRLTLPSVPPGQHKLFVVSTDREWLSHGSPPRRLGAQVKPIRLRRFDAERSGEIQGRE